jgi:serralysin
MSIKTSTAGKNKNTLVGKNGGHTSIDGADTDSLIGDLRPAIHSGIENSIRSDFTDGPTASETLSTDGGGGSGGPTDGGGIAAITITGTSGNDSLAGTTGDDVILGLGGNDLLQGLEGNDALDGGTGADTLIGGLGDDVYIVDNAGDVVTEAVNEGADTVRTTLANYTLGANVENLIFTGTGSFTGRGNELSNSIFGGAKDDFLDGKAGGDALIGGAGNDTYVVDNVGDLVIEQAGEGVDTVETTLRTYTLGANVENLIYLNTSSFIGTGNELDNTITGAAGNDTLSGGLGNDTLNGFFGEDTLFGGQGNDVYVVDNALDRVIEAAGEGTDEVRTSLTSYTLGADVENLTFIGAGNFTGTGNALDNTITGGAGTDVLAGGLGNDVYVIDSVLDTVTEAANAGTDEIRTTSNSYALGANLENLTFTGTGNFTGIGNALDNIITGGAGNDTLFGGAGNDTLEGGLGEDLAVFSGALGVDYRIDTVDGVIKVRHLVAGTGLIDGTTTLLHVQQARFNNATIFLGVGDTIVGTAGNDTLTGTSGNDLLDGGAGADTMTGGIGNDTYIVDNVGDVVIELAIAPGGTDEVRTTLNSYELGFAVENLTFTGTGTFTGIGNGFNNVIRGGRGDDTLDGGQGDDTLDGGAGADHLIGGGGMNIASYETSTVGVTASLADPSANTGDAMGDIYESIEGLTGSGFADTLTGDDRNNVLNGGAGDDRLDAGAGDDTLNGGLGADVLIGGDGIDTVTYANAAAGVTANLITGRGTGGEAAGDTYDSIENLTGSNGADILTGDDNNNVLKGGAGDDTLDGGAGDDTLNGGEGNDTLKGGIGIDTADYSGGPLGVTITLDANGNASGTSVGGGATGDVLTGIENLTGSRAADVLTGNDGANVLAGGEDNDRLNGGAGNDTLIGDDGDDVLIGGAGADRLIGGIGNDTADYSSSIGGVTIALNDDGSALSISGRDAAGDVLSGIENLTGSSSSNSTLTGNASVNVLTGGSGSDVLDGGVDTAGNDILIGGAGNDTYIVRNAGDVVTEASGAGTGTDEVRALVNSYTLGANVENLTFIGSGNFAGTGNGLDNVISGGSGNDVLNGGAGNDVLAGGGGGDTLNGGLGIDTADYTSSTGGVSIALKDDGSALSISGGDAAGDVLSGIENLTGSASADTLTGNASDNVLIGGGGNDTLNGGAGNDTLYADIITNAFLPGGDDTLIGGMGADTLISSSGTDFASYITASTGVTASLWNSGIPVNTGDAAGDVYIGIANLAGSAFADTLIGDFGDNILFGDAGSDTLDGGTGTGNDTLIGGAGADVLIGGEDGDIYGTDGRDAASYATATTGVTASLMNSSINTGDAAGDTYVSIEDLIGSKFGDTLIGGQGGDFLIGFGSVLTGGAGADTLIGMSGSDSAGYATASVGVTASLADSSVNTGDAQGDRYIGISSLIGSDFNDILIGNAGFNSLIGGAGDDILVGGAGGDLLEGNTGNNTASYATASAGLTASLANRANNTGDAKGDFYSNIQNLIGSSLDDTLIGDANDNILAGGTGNDTLTGGAGNDTFVFSAGLGHDVVTDYTAGHDHIQIRDGLFANGNAALAAAKQTGSDVTITVDSSDSIVLQNFSLANLHASDFVIDASLAQLVQAMASYEAADSGDAITSQVPNDPALGNTLAASLHS